MSLDYTVNWQEVENTVNDRILDDSLLHTLNSNKKIKKETKIFNQKLKRTRANLRGYKHFLKLKKQARSACQDGDETDDEPGLSHEAYKKIHSEKSKSQLQIFLKLCTQTKKHEYPKKTKGKSPAHKSEKLNKSATSKRPNLKTTSKANIVEHRVKSTEKPLISNSNNVRSKLSKTERQSSEIKLLNTRRVIHALDEENFNQNGLQKDDNTDEKNSIKKIVQNLLCNNVEKKAVDESSESDSEKVEPAAIKDNVIVGNLSKALTANEPQYNVTDRSKTCLELDNDSVVSNDQGQDNCEVITHVTDHLNASDSVLDCKEISNKDSLHSQEDIFMTNDETLSMEEFSSNENNNKKSIDNLNHDPSQESLSDADISRAECGKSSDDEVTACGYHEKRLVTEHCSSINEEKSIPPDDIVEFQKNVMKLNKAVSNVISNNEMDDEVKLSDSNLDTEGSKDIISTEQTCDLQLESELSTKSAANDKSSKLQIITIEHYDERYEIFSKRSLQNVKKLKIVNDFDNKSMENELISKDVQLLRSRKSSEDCYLSQSDSQHLNALTDHEDSIETKSVDGKLPSENEQSMKLKKSCEDCDLSQYESQHLNGLIDHEDSSPLFKQNTENCNNSMNNELLPEGEEQTEGNESSKEYNTPEIQSQHLNQSLNSSFSSFSTRSCVEDLKNIVKTQLLSEIEQRLRDTPSSKKNRSSRTRSKIFNGSLHNETENSMLVSNSNEEDIEDELIENQSLIEDDAQSIEDNRSTKESNSPTFQQQSSNRSSDLVDSFSFPKSSTPTNRPNFTDYCLLENTPRSSKLLRLDEESTHRKLESIPCKRKSQKDNSHELQSTKNRDDSQDHNKQELNKCKNVDRIPKRRPRPRNLEDLVITETLTEDTTKPYFRLKDISEDDEIWIMDVPKTINPKDLEEQTMSLGGKSILKFGDDYYKVSSKPGKVFNVSCIFTTSRKRRQYQIANIESKGNIKFHQQVSAIPETKLIPSKVAAVPFPKNLKIRHPLLGATYKDKI